MQTIAKHNYPGQFEVKLAETDYDLDIHRDGRHVANVNAHKFGGVIDFVAFEDKEQYTLHVPGRRVRIIVNKDGIVIQHPKDEPVSVQVDPTLYLQETESA